MKQLIKKILSMGIPIPKLFRPVIRGLYKLGVIICEGGVFLRKFFFVEPVLRSIAEVGKGLRADRLPYIRGKGRLIIGDNVRLSGRSCFYFMNSEEGKNTSRPASPLREPEIAEREPGVQEESKNPKHQPTTEQPDNLTTAAKRGSELPTITIGDGTFIGNGCTISCARSVKIGKEVLISSGVRIHDNDGHPHDSKKRRAGGKIGENEIADVSIGDGAWLGAGAMVMKGVNIEEDEIVGAGDVLRRSN